MCTTMAKKYKPHYEKRIYPFTEQNLANHVKHEQTMNSLPIHLNLKEYTVRTP